MTQGLKKPSGQTWARLAYDFREKAEKLEAENARLREALVRMLMWQPRSTEAACEQDYEFARSVVASAWRKP